MTDLGNLKFFLIAEREISSMVSVSTEYLCLSKGSTKKFLISVAGYEALGNVADYYDEEKDSYEIPNEIDGKKVHGVQDDWIVGGEIYLDVYNNGIEFDTLPNNDVQIWLDGEKWSKMVDSSDLNPSTDTILLLVSNLLSQWD